MQQNEKHDMTARNVAGLAITAYIAVRVTKAVGATAVNLAHFRQARKANRPIKA